MLKPAGVKLHEKFWFICAQSVFNLWLNLVMRNPIIVALDVPTADAALKLVEQLAPAAGGFKIGSELFTSAGPDIVRRVRATGASVFLDLKFHDIPNTVAKAVTSAVQLDVQMLTVHTSGGFEMLKAAENAAQETAWKLGRMPPLVLGVTVLTSLDAGALREIGGDGNLEFQVRRLAMLATKAGLRGLVCSPLEVTSLRKVLPASTQLVTPGVRTGAEKADDQKRTLTPREALDAGANWLVIGRPIYAADNPRTAAEKILKSLT
jgi:orotidine-5'-phosphate decarboxylase